MEFKKTQLDNGLTILGEVTKSAQSAAVGFFVRTGSRDETPRVNGVSHFLEHMTFKGTDGLSALEVNEAFDRLGAKFNAFTSEENTVYYAAVLPEYLGKVTELWIQLMRPSLRDDDFNIEKNVIKEEIAMYKDYPQFDVMDQCRTLHFKDHPCAFSVLGTEQSISDMTAEQMRSYFSQRYAPNNMVLAFCGNFDFDKVCDLARSKCSGWQRQSTERKLSFYDGSKEKQRQEKDNLVCEHICMMSPMVSTQDQGRFAASLLSMIIGDHTGSKYFWALVDTAIAEVALMQYEPMDGVGVLYSYIRCEPQQSQQVQHIIAKVLDDINSKGVTDSELQKAKNKVLSALTIKSERPMGRLIGLGFDWIYLEKYLSLQDDINAIKAVTVDEVNALIRKFNPADFTQLCMGPPTK